MNYRTERISEPEMFQKSLYQALQEREGGYVLALLTDRIELCLVSREQLDREELYRKALEIRIFDKCGESKWFRGSIADEFRFRQRGEEEGEKPVPCSDGCDWLDEEQYLDIDEKRSKPGKGYVKATGGGTYPFPLSYKEKDSVRIRNYLSYEEDTGELYISDWRLVDFVKAGEGNYGKV